MENKKKLIWSKPKCQTLDEKNIKESINVSACSLYSDCTPSAYYLDSLPGFDISTI